MKLTTTQISDFRQLLVDDLESQVWDFIKTYASELTPEGTTFDVSDAISDELIKASEGLTFSFN